MHRFKQVKLHSLEAKPILITFDVSNVPEGILEKYEWVDIISPIHTVDELAYEASTISYELLTALGANIKKEYVT